MAHWPADVHIIGKDITRFHTVYWPAFLMSAGVELPKSVFAHGFLLHRGEKMSKSAGNVIDPMELAERYGVDALRYFLLREVTFGQDGSYSDEAIVTRANADLSNSFGNLAQRVLSFIAKNLGRVPGEGRTEPADAELLGLVAKATREELPTAFSDLALAQGCEAWMRAVFACNQYVDAQAPWTLRKTDPERLEAVLRTLVLAIRDLALAIRPVIPASADKLLDMLGAVGRSYADLADHGWIDGTTLQSPTPVFPRLKLPAAA
jgi:methionyl-tRNA synthetase